MKSIEASERDYEKADAAHDAAVRDLASTLNVESDAYDAYDRQPGPAFRTAYHAALKARVNQETVVAGTRKKLAAVGRALDVLLVNETGEQARARYLKKKATIVRDERAGASGYVVARLPHARG
jgi:hypothetical protein